MSTIGILLTNSGTPEQPTPNAVKQFLRAFLSDRRIVHIPRLLWLPILHGLVLPLRAHRSARLYQKIWTRDGSPMRLHMDAIANDLQSFLQTEHQVSSKIAIGMNYGEPSIPAALATLADCHPILMLPLYPQYSYTTTAASLDRIHKSNQRKNILIHEHYATHPAYIEALARSIENHWETKGQGEQLLISFHGIPERFHKKGDPYADLCQQTANLLANRLQLNNSQWQLCFQSKFGYDKWLQPSTQNLLSSLPINGIKKIDIICPGFAVDCLETLEEIAIRGKESFYAAGGTSLNYISALNNQPDHLRLLAELALGLMG